MSASDPSVSRVNYFNGQRLDADDFRAEQDYQIAVRRKLYSALYSVGIVQGLEVTPHPSDPHQVIVAPGVALDFLGREIILLSTTGVIAAGTPTTNPAAIFGNYLVISYTEQRTQAVSDGCVAGNGAFGGTLAWGAATRIVAQPKLQFTDTFPPPNNGQIVLAQVALGTGCQVGPIESGVRQYAVPAKPPTTRPISLEGEKDIDSQNPKILYFHIDGGSPSTVTLYLRATQFSSLYYTELGAHTHNDQLTAPDLTVPAHTHKLDNIATGAAEQDAAKPIGMSAISFDTDYNNTNALRLWGAGNDPNVRNNQLTLPLLQGEPALVSFQNLSEHTHNLANGSVTGAAGAIDQPLGIKLTPSPAGLAGPARTAAAGVDALTYVDTLRVFFDGQEITGSILTQLNDSTNWPSLGDGTGTSALVIKPDGTGGTPAIALDQLGLNLNVGPHHLTFQVTKGGGQIQYNLYVG